MIDLTKHAKTVYSDLGSNSTCSDCGGLWADFDHKCECGDPECLGPVEIAGAIAQSLAKQLPQLQSPMLKLIKERNEARRMCELLAGSFPDIATLTTEKAITAANAEIHQALWAYCKAKKHWDKRSYELGGEQ